MEIYLQREPSGECTIGRLSIPDIQFSCWVLELPNPIAAGRYEVIINYSNRFKRNMPLLLNVPKQQGIRIHAGNTIADTEGCLCLGLTRKRNWIGVSRHAVAAFEQVLQSALNDGKAFITIKDADSIAARSYFMAD